MADKVNDKHVAVLEREAGCYRDTIKPGECAMRDALLAGAAALRALGGDAALQKAKARAFDTARVFHNSKEREGAFGPLECAARDAEQAVEIFETLKGAK